MDESLQKLEAELKALKPRRPSAQLIAQVELDLEVTPARSHYTTATNLSSWKWFGWRTAVAAAAVALVAAVGLLNFKPAQPVEIAKSPDMIPTVNPAPVDSTAAAPVARDLSPPVAATNVLYDLKDEGTVQVDGDTEARRLRYRYLDTYTVKNPRSNASLTWSVPRDEIRVVPVRFN